MPYYVTDAHPDCSTWGTVKDDGELIACHPTKQAAIDQMVAISIQEGLAPGGTYEGQFRSEQRAVDLTPPAYMRAAARRGLAYYEEGKGGDGLVPRTIREAREMAAGNVSADKWVRIAAWIARHLVDLDAPAANPDNEDYPSAGVVAHLLWGSPATKSGARRAMEYAENVVARLEQENANRANGGKDTMAKIEIRTTPGDFEVRESTEGMTFEAYAAVFNSPSGNLGGFTERIAPGAFRRTLEARNDIKLLWNHDSGEVLGSTRAGTLQLEERERGLWVRAVFPNTTRGRDASELVRRGDVSAMSFGFSVPAGGDSWNAEGNERTLKSVRLHEVSIVAFPAYEGTTGLTSVRALDRVALLAQVDNEMLVSALEKVQAGEMLTSEEVNSITAVIAALSPEEPVAEIEVEEEYEGEGMPTEPMPAEATPTGDVGMLELIKTKLNLMENNND